MSASKASEIPPIVPPRVFSHDVKPFAVVHCLIPFAEQDAWRAHPALNGFCVFYAGWYVKARGHLWQRDNVNEGIYIYCTAGKGFYRCDGRECPVGAGDLLYCSPFTRHSYGADARQPWTIYWMHVAGSEIATYSSLLGFTRDRPVIRVGARPRAIALFKTVFQFLKPPMTEIKMATLAGAGRLLLASMASEAKKPVATPTIAVNIQRVLETMENRVEERPGIADWAKLFGGSRSHFQRQFKHYTGHSPNEYFLRMKIQKACSLLTGTSLRVSEVADRIGFSDPYYFSRLFRRLTGHTARDYRVLTHQDNISGTAASSTGKRGQRKTVGESGDRHD